MNFFLILAFLFFIGSIMGWIIELFFRRFISKANPERKWINPGFCTGPYLPLYGAGLCILFLIASLEDLNLISSPFWNKAVLFLAMAIFMTLIEYITGIVCLKSSNVRLWDYSEEWGNINGIICPKFSLIWALCGAAYYFLVHPYIKNALAWLSENLAFSFFIGVFFGVFIIDVAHSAQFISKLRKFAVENDVIVRYEHLKSRIRSVQDKNKEKVHFFLSFKTERPLTEHLKNVAETLEKRIRKK